MSCLGRDHDDGWSDCSIEPESKLQVGSLVEIRLPPTASKKLQINSNHSDVYEATSWVRARVRAPSGSEVKSEDSDQRSLLFSLCEFELLYPENLAFQTHQSDVATGINNSHTASQVSVALDEDELPPPRQLSFSDQFSASNQRPFSVNWHITGPKNCRQMSSRNVRLPQFADSLDQAYVKGSDFFDLIFP
jgi:hypothetical protein